MDYPYEEDDFDLMYGDELELLHEQEGSLFKKTKVMFTEIFFPQKLLVAL